MITEISPAEAKAKLTEIYKKHKPLMDKMRDYGERVLALSLEYHVGRLEDEFCDVEELVLLATLDIRETPVSLNRAILELRGLYVKRIIFSRPEGKFYVFGCLPKTKSDIQQEPTIERS